MKRRFLAMVAVGLALCLAAAPAWGDDFYVIAGGGTSGKVLKTQVFTSLTTNPTLGEPDAWTKLGSPQWSYTKLSATSYLVITYQDAILCTSNSGMSFLGIYQVRVNDQVNVAGEFAAGLVSSGNWINQGVTAVWSGLPKGEVNLSIWHYQYGCTACEQNSGGWTTNVMVMEIEH